jgi:hypothetical protein
VIVRQSAAVVILAPPGIGRSCKPTLSDMQSVASAMKTINARADVIRVVVAALRIVLHYASILTNRLDLDQSGRAQPGRLRQSCI